jgi:hypothetical protein
VLFFKTIIKNHNYDSNYGRLIESQRSYHIEKVQFLDTTNPSVSQTGCRDTFVCRKYSLVCRKYSLVCRKYSLVCCKKS